MAVRRSAIAEELTCSICLDEFDDPRILPCGHCYCRTCIVQLSNTAVRRAFPCPECRKRTVLPSNDPNKLPISLLALRMKEKLQGQCEQLCSKHDEPMKLFCCDCKYEVCINCALIDHREHNYQLMNEGKTVNDKTSSTTMAISVHPVPSSPVDVSANSIQGLGTIPDLIPLKLVRITHNSNISFLYTVAQS